MFIIIAHVTTLFLTQSLASHGWVIVNNKLEKVQKEPEVAYLKVMPCNLPGWTEKNRDD